MCDSKDICLAHQAWYVCEAAECMIAKEYYWVSECTSWGTKEGEWYTDSFVQTKGYWNNESFDSKGMVPKPFFAITKICKWHKILLHLFSAVGVWYSCDFGVLNFRIVLLFLCADTWTKQISFWLRFSKVSRCLDVLLSLLITCSF